MMAATDMPIAQRVSPRLAAALGDLAGFCRREPDFTLHELRLALFGTGFRWSSDGSLGYSPDHVSLVDELDDLIKSGAEPFPQG